VSHSAHAPHHTHSPECGCGHEHPDVTRGWSVPVLFAGLALVVNAYVNDWLFPENRLASQVSAALGALALAAPIFRQAFRDLWKGQLHMETLVSLAVVASFAEGQFKVAGVVAFFMLLSFIIESRSAAGAHKAIESLIRMAPAFARRRLNDGSEQEVPTSDLLPGEIIRVRPGENVPVDGVICQGDTTLNEATITGESVPRDKSAGDDVFAGTENLTGAVDIKVSRVGADTTLGRVRELILAAEKSRLPVMRLMDRYIAYYTPLVLMLAALCWFFTNEWGRVTTILVVSCPCAIILAAPTAMVAALSAAARLGILVKHVADLEAFSRTTAIVFDKTGTLTTGQLGVHQLVPASGVESQDLLALAASAEQHSNHPAARALVTLASEVGLPLVEPSRFTEAAGRGVSADIKGRSVLVGRKSWLIEQGIQLAMEDQSGEGSLVCVAADGKFMGHILLRDQIRPEAATAMRTLRDMHVRFMAMVTGDRAVVARSVGEKLGLTHIEADCLPGGKVEFVNQVKARHYRVAVVGDGVNDAPALAAGDTGIAMGAAGSDVAINSATMALMNNDLRRIPMLFLLSRQARAAILQNLLVGVLFIIGGWTFAFTGDLNSIAAALLHNFSAFFVIFNSARIVRAGEEMMESAALS